MFRLLVILTAVAACCVYACSGKTKKQIIYTTLAPKPIGPYSQAIFSGGTLYVSGQIGLNRNGTLDSSSIENECRQALTNIKVIVEAAGMKLSDVNKSTIYCTDLRNFAKINMVYTSFFFKRCPCAGNHRGKSSSKGSACGDFGDCRLTKKP